MPNPLKKPISALKDEDGRDVQVVYKVKLSFVVSAVCPVHAPELAELVNERIKAGGGITPYDVDDYKIIAVEAM